MKLQLTFALLLLPAVVGLTGCYTQLGYYASADFEGRYTKVLEDEGTKHHSKTESEESESERHTDEERLDAEDSEGYYGRRKFTYRKSRRYASPYRYDSYWGPYAPSWYYAYPPVFYYPHPWFSRYYRPYYGYYRTYYPYYGYYQGYYPYTNVYRRYRGGNSYTPLSRRTYDRGSWRSENRRSRNSRSVTTPRTRSERPQRRIRNRNENE